MKGGVLSITSVLMFTTETLYIPMFGPEFMTIIEPATTFIMGKLIDVSVRVVPENDPTDETNSDPMLFMAPIRHDISLSSVPIDKGVGGGDATLEETTDISVLSIDWRVG